MRKDLSEFLSTDLQFIKGVGPVLAARLDDVIGGRRVVDFLLHRPAYVRNRDVTECINDVNAGDIATIPLLVKSQKKGGTFRGRHRPTQIMCADKSGNSVVVQFFNSSYLDYWLKKLPVGQWRMVSGRVDAGRIPTMNHPEFIEEMDKASKIPTSQAIYPSGEGLSQKTFANIRNQIFERLGDIVSHEPDDRMREFFDALHHIHFAATSDDLLPNATYMAKLAYCELLAHQSAIAISRRNRNDICNKKMFVQQNII